MAGLEVTRANLDAKASDAIISFRRAIRECQKVDGWLSLHPSNAAGGDLLTTSETDGGFGYTADEAYLIRVLFERIRNLDTESILNDGKKLTGLE